MNSNLECVYLNLIVTFNHSAAAKLSKRYTNHCVRTTALEQFSTSRRARQNNMQQQQQQQLVTQQQQQQQVASAAAATLAAAQAAAQAVATSPSTSSASSPRSQSPCQSNGSTSGNSNRSSPQLNTRCTLPDYKNEFHQVFQQAAQYQHSLQQFAQSQMENQLHQMKQNHTNALNALNFLNSSNCINPLSSPDPLYDAPPATPIYTKSEEGQSSPMGNCSSSLSDLSADLSSMSSTSSTSGAQNRCSTPKSEMSSSSNLGKISSEDLLNFQASTEAQAFMMNTLNQLGQSDISDRIAAMGSLFGLDDYNFNNLKQFTQLSNSISPLSCSL